MTDDYLIRLSWPDPSLSSNSRDHWAVVRKAKKAQRYEAKIASIESGLHNANHTHAILDFFFFPPDRRRRDAQNMPAMMKSAIDGIADAMGCDDHNFVCRFQGRFEEPVKGGSVLIKLTPKEKPDNSRICGVCGNEIPV